MGVMFPAEEALLKARVMWCVDVMLLIVMTIVMAGSEGLRVRAGRVPLAGVAAGLDSILLRY